ncbi:MAG: type II secretion system protein N [Rhodocyclaceae bacterium]|nr:type II secretion system protein N [Rhodocyclaceae bacterium]
MQWRLFVVGIGVYAVALAATVPATLADGLVREASGGRLRLAAVQGTLWSGAGQIELRTEGEDSGLTKRLTWHLQPKSWLHATLTYAVVTDQEPRPITVTISWSRIQFENIDISMPAWALGIAVPRLSSLELTGEIQLRANSLSFGRNDTQGSATLQWQVAGSTLTPVSPLGSYELRLVGEGPSVHAALNTLQGPLQLDGQGSWGNDRKPVFIASARMPPQFRQQLAPFLRMIAIERDDGSFALQIK